MFNNDLIRAVFDDDFLFNPRRPSSRLRSEDVVLKETEEGLVLELGVPGCVEKDISVEVSSTVISIKATVREREIERNYKMPEGVNVDGVSAKVENGLLRIILPRCGMKKVL